MTSFPDERLRSFGSEVARRESAYSPLAIGVDCVKALSFARVRGAASEVKGRVSAPASDVAVKCSF